MSDTTQHQPADEQHFIDSQNNQNNDQDKQNHVQENNSERSLVVMKEQTRANELFSLLVDDFKPLHFTRIRQRPHRAGDYPGSIYITLPPRIKDELLLNIQQQLPQNTTFKIMNELHISMCKEFTLREHQIPLFVQTIKQRLRKFHSFSVELNDGELLLNDENNTEFLVENAHGIELNSLVDLVDSVMESFGLEKYYKERKLHTSLFYRLDSLGDVIDLPSFDKTSFHVQQVTMRIGDVVYTCVLSLTI
ncbi:U6 snRNA phosphodiesterase 1 [Entamoeba marina]